MSKLLAWLTRRPASYPQAPALANPKLLAVHMAASTWRSER